MGFGRSERERFKQELPPTITYTFPFFFSILGESPIIPTRPTMSPLPSAPEGYMIPPEITPSTFHPPPALNPITWQTSKAPMNYLPTPSRWLSTSNHPRVLLTSRPLSCQLTETLKLWGPRLLHLLLRRFTRQWEGVLLRERELGVDKIGEMVVIVVEFFFPRQFVIVILVTSLWVYLNSYSLLMLRLHTAINRADFVSWWMWFNGSHTEISK